MGFLFTYDELRRGEVPTLHDFRELRDFSLAKLDSCDAIVSGGVLGSAAIDEQRVDSDLDLFVVCRTNREEEAIALVEEIRQEALDRYVKLDARVITVRNARLGNHFFGPSYKVTWRILQEQGMMVGHVPFIYFWGLSGSVQTSMRRKMLRNYQSVRMLAHYSKRRNWTPEQIDAILKRWKRANIRPLHFYVRLLRWMLWWKHGTLSDDRLQAVVADTLGDADLQALWPMVKRLHQFHRRYLKMIRAVRDGFVSQQAYEEWLCCSIKRICTDNLTLLEAALSLTEEQEEQLIEQVA